MRIPTHTPRQGVFNGVWEVLLIRWKRLDHEEKFARDAIVVFAIEISHDLGSMIKAWRRANRENYVQRLLLRLVEWSFGKKGQMLESKRMKWKGGVKTSSTWHSVVHTRWSFQIRDNPYGWDSRVSRLTNGPLAKDQLLRSCSALIPTTNHLLISSSVCHHDLNLLIYTHSYVYSIDIETGGLR